MRTNKSGTFSNFKTIIATSLVWVMILSATTVFANPQILQAIRGNITISLDGVNLNLAEEDRPVIIDGRTFLPVRALADSLGLNVDWDGATETVILQRGGTPTPPVHPPLTPPPAPAATRFADTFFTGTTGSNFARVDDTLNILGTAHTNVVQYNAFARNAVYSQHNLSGNFDRLAGVFGRVDGVGTPADVVVTITGDGTVLLTFELSQHDMPRNIDLDVTGVNLIRVDIQPDGAGGPQGTRTAWAFSADLS
ncbi:MAG: stalk domain-containing protein [Defluviitaleaceae bacterium]|nr:stalk domain-containing protein [Defluviitaleaceae bacterium]